jgi:hypothetical protein
MLSLWLSPAPSRRRVPLFPFWARPHILARGYGFLTPLGFGIPTAPLGATRTNHIVCLIF